MSKREVCGPCEATTAVVLANLGFDIEETEEDDAFVEGVGRLATAGDVEGLINLIAGGATYGESREMAEKIIEAVQEVTP